MNTIDLSPHGSLYVAYCQARGRGVFTHDKILPGELICYSFSWELSPRDIRRFQRIEELGEYWFEHPTRAEWGLLPAGIVELVNHSETPNCELRWCDQGSLGYVGTLYGLEEILRDSELLIDYGISLPEGWVP